MFENDIFFMGNCTSKLQETRKDIHDIRKQVRLKDASCDD